MSDFNDSPDEPVNLRPNVWKHWTHYVEGLFVWFIASFGCLLGLLAVALVTFQIRGCFVANPEEAACHDSL